MPNIKEIAMKVGFSTVPAGWLSEEKPIACATSNLERLVAFAEALIAELAKGNEPVAFTNSCELDYLDFKRADSGLVSAAMWKDYDKDSDIALYALPPTASQIEQETAEAWQPIETAPKYGRTLILILTPSGFPQVAYANTWWTCGFSVENKPTHWMPLPTPPKRNDWRILS